MPARAEPKRAIEEPAFAHAPYLALVAAETLRDGARGPYRSCTGFGHLSPPDAARTAASALSISAGL